MLYLVLYITYLLRDWPVMAGCLSWGHPNKDRRNIEIDRYYI